MSNATDERGGRGVWAQPRFIVAAVVIALIAVMAVALILTTREDTADATPSRTETATSSLPASSVTRDGDVDASVCGLEEGDQTIPVTAPTTSWELVGTVAAPTTPEVIGPGSSANALRSCFARSPQGALYAAANVLALTSIPERREDIVRRLTIDGPSQDRALELLEAEGEPVDTGTRFQISGFTISQFDRSSATVDLALRVDTGALAHIIFNLTWQEGDWKVAFSPDGQLAIGPAVLPDLTGYVPWSGA